MRKHIYHDNGKQRVRNYGNRYVLEGKRLIPVGDPGETMVKTRGNKEMGILPDIIIIPGHCNPSQTRQGFLNAQRAKDAMMWFMLGAGSVWMAFTTTMLFI